MTIGHEIRAHRHAQGLTQAQCGAKMSVGKGRWADIEAGRKSMTLKTLDAVAGALGFRVEIRLVRRV